MLNRKSRAAATATNIAEILKANLHKDGVHGIVIGVLTDPNSTRNIGICSVSGSNMDIGPALAQHFVRLFQEDVGSTLAIAMLTALATSGHLPPEMLPEILAFNAARAAEDEDCGDPDCIVHGKGDAPKNDNHKPSKKGA